MEKTVDEKLVMMEKKINNLQSQRPESVRVVSEGHARVKQPCFDGILPLSVFKLQFETVESVVVVYERVIVFHYTTTHRKKPAHIKTILDNANSNDD